MRGWKGGERERKKKRRRREDLLFFPAPSSFSCTSSFLFLFLLFLLPFLLLPPLHSSFSPISSQVLETMNESLNAFDVDTVAAALRQVRRGREKMGRERRKKKEVKVKEE